MLTDNEIEESLKGISDIARYGGRIFEDALLDTICKHINENIWGECKVFNGNYLFRPVNAIVVQYRIRDKAKVVYIDLMQTDYKKWEKIIRKVVYRIEETEVFGHGE